MKPRIFVSSTYYDLKYIRENIQKFIEKFNFESVLSEAGDITFEHGKELDESCYEAVKQCHMMILIVGGRYGSAASSEKHRKKYDSEYISITRKEVETAFEMNLPVFIFVEKNVYAEFQTFLKNRDVKGIKYAHVDNINVFKFVESLMSKPIATFEKVEEIENYLDNQIAGMFYLYLQGLQQEKMDSKILDSVEELKKITKVMNEMLNKVGEKTIDAEDYKDAIRKQNEIMIEYYAEIFNSNVSFDWEADDTPLDINAIAKQIFEVLEEMIFKNDKHILQREGRGAGMIDSDIVSFLKTYESINDKIKEFSNFTLKDLAWPVYSLYFKNIYPVIAVDSELRKIFKNTITTAIRDQLAILTSDSRFFFKRN